MKRTTATYKMLLKQIKKDDEVEAAIIAGLCAGDEKFSKVHDRYIAVLTALDEAGFVIQRKRQHRRTEYVKIGY